MVRSPAGGFGADVNILSHSGWRRAEGGLLSPNSLLHGNWVILICIEEDECDIDVAFTSSPNLLVAIADSSFISTGQENYNDD